MKGVVKKYEDIAHLPDHERAIETAKLITSSGSVVEVVVVEYAGDAPAYGKSPREDAVQGHFTSRMSCYECGLLFYASYPAGWALPLGCPRCLKLSVGRALPYSEVRNPRLQYVQAATRHASYSGGLAKVAAGRTEPPPSEIWKGRSMALGVGVVVGLILGILLVGLIGGNREQAAPTAPPPRTVTVEETVETTVEKTVPATTPDATPATATATATATAYP
jgi:hypothetical protein